MNGSRLMTAGYSAARRLLQSRRRLILMSLVLLAALGYPLACLLHCTVPPAVFTAAAAEAAEHYLCDLPSDQHNEPLPVPTRIELTVTLLLFVTVTMTRQTLLYPAAVHYHHELASPPLPPPRAQRSYLQYRFVWLY